MTLTSLPEGGARGEQELREQLAKLPIHYLKSVDDPNFYLASETVAALTQLIQERERLAVEAARSKDPFKCEFGHQVYSHRTAEGWCCACEADISRLVSLTQAKETKQDKE